MVLPTGVLLIKLDQIKSTLSRKNVHEACSLPMAENMLTLLIIFGFLNMGNIYRLKVSLFTHNLKNDKSNTPAVLLNILAPSSEIHPYNARYAANQKISLSHQYAPIMVYLHLNSP